LITLAPKSVNSMPAAGPVMNVPISSTVMSLREAATVPPAFERCEFLNSYIEHSFDDRKYKDATFGRDCRRMKRFSANRANE
jgi:hypothetical protein